MQGLPSRRCFARDIPLTGDVTSQAQFDHSAIQIAIRAGLTLWPDSVLESHEEFVAEPRDVVGVALSASVWRVAVPEGTNIWWSDAPSNVVDTWNGGEEC
jgi:hypothetical protein